MTTPSINNPYAIIADAMADAGLLQDTDTPTPEQYAKYMRRLRDVINFIQTKGIKLWLNVDTAIPLVANQATYVLSPTGDVVMTKPLRVIQGYYLYSTSNVIRPLTPMSWDDYLSLGQIGTTNAGSISSYFANKKATTLDVTFWLCPDSTDASAGQAHLLLQTQVTNPVNLTETMNFPEEWRMALRWGLAADICTGQPSAVVERCEMKAEIYRTALEDWDVEDAPTSYQPDPQSGVAGRFR